jgi:hypothetical protein
VFLVEYVWLEKMSESFSQCILAVSCGFRESCGRSFRGEHPGCLGNLLRNLDTLALSKFPVTAAESLSGGSSEGIPLNPWQSVSLDIAQAVAFTIYNHIH